MVVLSKAKSNDLQYEQQQPQVGSASKRQDLLRRSATPKASQRNINLADVDSYVDRVNKLKDGP